MRVCVFIQRAGRAADSAVWALVFLKIMDLGTFKRHKTKI